MLTTDSIPVLGAPTSPQGISTTHHEQLKVRLLQFLGFCLLIAKMQCPCREGRLEKRTMGRPRVEEPLQDNFPS